MSFRDQLAADAAQVAAYCAAAIAGQDDLAAAMRYAVTGGKGLRGFLVLESARLLGVKAMPAAAAIEMLHAYSLIHDDLPSMDDDDLRRGQPTVHIKWNEAVAILAGDALQARAFEMLTDPVLGDRRLDLVAGLARAAGAMVRGQAMDMAAQTVTQPLTLEQITELQAGKTGALIIWSATVGPVLAGADTAPLTRYAAALGLAFQIADDILDVTGDASKAGKRLNKDAVAGKATFVSLLGLDGARARARDLVGQAEAALAPYGAAAHHLIAAAQFAISRES